MKRRIAHYILTALLTLTLAAPAVGFNAAAVDNIKSTDYTNIPVLAERLDRVLSGDVELYGDIHCSSNVRAPLNTRAVPLGKTYYVKSASGNVYSGSSCYIYANAVYATLFGDVPFHGDDVGWLNSRRVAGNLASASYDGFTRLGVGFGALLRTTSNRDGGYNGSSGHSMVILKYDRSTVTYLEGNGDGKGLVRVAEKSWDSFNNTHLAGKGRRISFIVQPTEEYMETLAGGGKAVARDLVGYFSTLGGRRGNFIDVSLSAWYAGGVTAACEIGVLNGRSESRFAPMESVTVAEGVAVCAKFLSRYYADGWDFTASGAWYEPYYSYCRLWGIDVDFSSPNKPIKRADFVRLMSRALPDAALSAGKPVAFPDVPAGAYYADALSRLSAAGVILGANGRFMPASTLTRAEMAQIVARMADKNLRWK